MRNYGLRADPHRHIKMKLCFLVILVDMAAKRAVEMLAGFERDIFKYNFKATFVKKSPLKDYCINSVKCLY